MAFYSIIVPVYNVQQYLDECVKSLINQTFKDIEIILVDDGSQDSSGAMCEEYARLDERVKVIHKENGGLSSARNAGIGIATGKYILYVDSDDYLSLDYIEEMRKYLENKDYDMIIGKTQNFLDGTIPVCIEESLTVELSSVEALENIYYQRLFDTNACSKLMKKEIAKNHLFKNGVIYEDFDIIHEIIFSCKSILFMSKPKYFYRIRNDSIMSSSFNEKKLYLLDIADKHMHFVEENCPELKDAVIRRYVYSQFHILGRIVGNNQYIEKCRIIRDNILKYKWRIIFNSNVNLKEKVSVMILAIGLGFYRIMWNCYCKFNGKNV